MAGQLAILHRKDLSAGHYVQTFQANFLIHAKLLDTIDFYHFVPLSVTMTLAGVTRSVQSFLADLH